jgi:low affinity Fe/Cu permease
MSDHASAHEHVQTLRARHDRTERQRFHQFAVECGRLAGKPATFMLALAIVAIWAVAGPVFGFSDTWQLVINTSTTIIAFLMVFLIQNAQNRESIALQVKLGELILALEGAHNKLAVAEEMDERQLQRVKEIQSRLAARDDSARQK